MSVAFWVIMKLFVFIETHESYRFAASTFLECRHRTNWADGCYWTNGRHGTDRRYGADGCYWTNGCYRADGRHGTDRRYGPNGCYRANR